MFSIGIDISKLKSTVAILSQYGEIVHTPFEMPHTESALSNLAEMAGSLKGEHGVYRSIPPAGP